jgi:hypothetical protein
MKVKALDRRHPAIRRKTGLDGDRPACSHSIASHRDLQAYYALPNGPAPSDGRRQAWINLFLGVADRALRNACDR